MKPNIYDKKADALRMSRDAVKDLFWHWLYGRKVDPATEEHMRDIAVEHARELTKKHAERRGG